MSTNARCSAHRIIAGILFVGIVSPSILHAAEVVRWEDLAVKIKPGNRNYRVVTKSGITYDAAGLRYGPLRPGLTIFAHVFIVGPTDIEVGDTGQFIRRDQVAEIRIRHHASLLGPLLYPAEVVLFIGSAGGAFYPVGTWLFTPVAAVASAAAAPIILPIVSAQRLVPDTVFKIAP